MRALLFRGFLGSLTVLLGGLVTAPIPADGWVASMDLLDALRTTPTGRMLGLVVVVSGLGVLTACWLRLLRAVVGVEEGVPRVVVATTVWMLPLLVAPPLFSRDGWSYAAQGYLQGRGLSPYVWTPDILSGPLVDQVDVRWLTTPAPYGPVPLVWGGAASQVVEDPWLLVIANRGFAVLGVVLLMWAVPRLARYAGRDPGLAAWLVLPSPLLLAHGVGGLHNDVVLAGLMAVALVVTIERSWAWGAVAGGLAAAVKVPGGLVCVGVVLLSLAVDARLPQRLRRLVGVAAVSVLTLVGVGVAAGVGVGWVEALDVPTTVMTPLSVTTLVGGLVQLVEPVRLLGSATALGIAGWLALRGPTGRTALGAASLLLLAVTVLSPVVHAWYAFWCVPLLAVTVAGERATSALVGASILLALSAPLDSSLEGAYVHIAITAGLVVLLAAAFLGRLPLLTTEVLRPLRSSSRAPAPAPRARSSSG